MTTRPPFILNRRDVPNEEARFYGDDEEAFGIRASLGRLAGLVRIGLHHETLLPGRRTSWPHAESAEEEFVYVLEGAPDAWINGELHPLREGDLVAFPAGTGIAHTVLNNTAHTVRLLVGGQTRQSDNRYIYPLHPERNDAIGDDLWKDCPEQRMGPHDGVPDGAGSR